MMKRNKDDRDGDMPNRDVLTPGAAACIESHCEDHDDDCSSDDPGAGDSDMEVLGLSELTRRPK